MKNFLKIFFVSLFFLSAHAGTTKITWHGHAAFEITTPKGTILFIDPWLKNPANAEAQDNKDPVANIKKADFIFVTHGHFDHIGDSIAIAKKTGARLVTNFDLGTNMARVLGYPQNQMGFDTLFNVGGEITLGDGELTVAMTPAIHSSSLEISPGSPLLYGGIAAGFVIKIKDGPTIYHSGDTAYFKDMELIGSTYTPDVALINIGGHFGMTPAMAAQAAQAVHAKVVIPQHFKTFPILTQDESAFFKALDQKHIAHASLKPGQSIEFDGTKQKK